MLEKNKKAILTLLSCGLKRQEFHVECKAIRKNNQIIGHDDPEVKFRCTPERQREVAPKLAQHWKVVQFTRNGKFEGDLHLFKGRGYFLNELNRGTNSETRQV